MLGSRQQIEQRGIDRLYFVSAEVAQDIVDAVEFAGNVAAILPVRSFETLTGMKIVKLERAVPKLDPGPRHRDRGDHQLRCSERANAQEASPR